MGVGGRGGGGRKIVGRGRVQGVILGLPSCQFGREDSGRGKLVGEEEDSIVLQKEVTSGL